LRAIEPFPENPPFTSTSVVPKNRECTLVPSLIADELCESRAGMEGFLAPEKVHCHTLPWAIRFYLAHVSENRFPLFRIMCLNERARDGREIDAAQSVSLWRKTANRFRNNRFAKFEIAYQNYFE
jgi:hypothetical protein